MAIHEINPSTYFKQLKWKEQGETDHFKPLLYEDLYIPSWVNGYSIAMEYIYNWFLDKFPKDFFKTIHIVGKHPFDDFRRFEYGEYVKREKPAVSFAGQIQYDFNGENVDIHMLGIDAYMKRTHFQRSFFKDIIDKQYIGFAMEQLLCNFTIRLRLNTRAMQLDTFKRMQIMFRIGCTETDKADMDFHIPYKLMYNIAAVKGFLVDTATETISEPYEFQKYLNRYSQIPFLYKLRYINGKHEYFIRMRDMPVYLDMRNTPDVDDGDQEGQLSTNYNIDMQVSIRIPVPKFYIHYSEYKPNKSIIVEPSTGITVYSMKVVTIPEVNDKGWPIYGTSNFLAEKDQKVVKEIDIEPLFKAPVSSNSRVDLEFLIQEAINAGISPSAFIDIGVYTQDVLVTGRLPITMDWKNRKILLPKYTMNTYFYLAVYFDLGYINSRIIDLDKAQNNDLKPIETKSDLVSKTAQKELMNDNE